jgi:hypothetical protein
MSLTADKTFAKKESSAENAESEWKIVLGTGPVAHIKSQRKKEIAPSVSKTLTQETQAVTKSHL